VEQKHRVGSSVFHQRVAKLPLTLPSVLKPITAYLKSLYHMPLRNVCPKHVHQHFPSVLLTTNAERIWGTAVILQRCGISLWNVFQLDQLRILN
jgi:hypothetical protein